MVILSNTVGIIGSPKAARRLHAKLHETVVSWNVCGMHMGIFRLGHVKVIVWSFGALLSNSCSSKGSARV